MSTTSIRRLLAGVVLLVGVVPATSASASPDDLAAPGDPAHAIYGDRIIDLSEGWQGAGACIELGTETRCYDTAEELAANHPEHAAGTDGDALAGSAALLTTCSSGLTLYTFTSYGTPSLVLTTRFVVFNLSTYGFDNITSSYKVGACAAEFWENANAGGAAYPGSTSAGAQSASMSAGWDNRVSSVYIY